MTESSTAPKSFTIAHRVALVFLFLAMAQPTFDNIRALVTGVMGSGDVSIEVTVGQLSLHLLAMVMGWIGFWWFFKRQKRGAYLSVAAHFLGLIAVVTQTPEMLAIMPPAVIAVFFVIMLAVALGPIFAFKEQYS